MRVEIFEERLKDMDPETGQHYNLVKGDRVNVPDSLGARWCALGWTGDLDGNVITGERDSNKKYIVHPDNSVHGLKVEGVSDG